MFPSWRALVGISLVTLLVNSVAGPRLHLHPNAHDRSGAALVHSHGSGEPHSHDRAPSTPDDEGEQRDTVIVFGAARALLSSSSAPALTAPVFLAEPAGAVTTADRGVLAADITPFHAHGPPSSPRLPARAPPPGLLRVS